MILFGISPFFQVVKSYTVMTVYSYIHEQKAFLKDEGIDIRLPGGLSTLERDYYPFVMTFDTEGQFGRRQDEDIDLVVLYNFGHMEWLKGSSTMYDVDSPYYSGFYGAYLARYGDGERQYGMNEDGTINFDEANAVTDYDLKVLVMRSVGNKEPDVTYDIKNGDDPEVKIIDGLEFQVFDADILMDGLYHNYEKDYMAYLQYGRPVPRDGLEDFPEVQMKGRFYVRFDTELGVSLFFYIIAPNEGTLQSTESSYIMKARIKGIH